MGWNLAYFFRLKQIQDGHFCHFSTSQIKVVLALMLAPEPQNGHHHFWSQLLSEGWLQTTPEKIRTMKFRVSQSTCESKTPHFKSLFNTFKKCAQGTLNFFSSAMGQFSNMALSAQQSICNQKKCGIKCTWKPFGKTVQLTPKRIYTPYASMTPWNNQMMIRFWFSLFIIPFKWNSFFHVCFHINTWNFMKLLISKNV